VLRTGSILYQHAHFEIVQNHRNVVSSTGVNPQPLLNAAEAGGSGGGAAPEPRIPAPGGPVPNADANAIEEQPYEPSAVHVQPTIILTLK
jgi:hypothetical protein